jgi:S-adenosylmethionine hydrolase
MGSDHMSTFAPSGVITLTTDFGHCDPFVGIMKGRILSIFPAAIIVDLTHEIPPFGIAAASFWLARAYAYFPIGTVHIAVVDPGVGTARNILAMEMDSHLFLAPDNGLLTGFPRKEHRVHTIDFDRLRLHGFPPPSATFHGRDIFAPVAGKLAAGVWHAHELGPASPLLPLGARGGSDEGLGIKGEVVVVDHFGNLLTNIERAAIERLRDPRVDIAGHSLRLCRTYGDALPGEVVALVNSFDVLEIAVVQGSAARNLNLGCGTPVQIGAKPAG